MVSSCALLGPTPIAPVIPRGQRRFRPSPKPSFREAKAGSDSAGPTSLSHSAWDVARPGLDASSGEALQPRPLSHGEQSPERRRPGAAAPPDPSVPTFSRDASMAEASGDVPAVPGTTSVSRGPRRFPRWQR